LGHDTIEANHLLGFGDDHRDYLVAAQMLLALGVRSVNLMTNNPAKIRGLQEHGIQVVGRIPVVVPPNRHNSRYLATKEKRAGHWLSPLTPADVGGALRRGDLSGSSNAASTERSANPEGDVGVGMLKYELGATER
jgi:hypothetical protein